MIQIRFILQTLMSQVYSLAQGSDYHNVADGPNLDFRPVFDF